MNQDSTKNSTMCPTTTTTTTTTTTESLEIDTNLRASLQNYSTFNSSSANSSSGSSTNNESSPYLTSTMISPEFHEQPLSSLPPSSLNNRIYEIISSENQAKKSINSNLIHSSHSPSSSTSSQSSSSSSSSSMDIYNHSTQRPSISSFVISAKSKTIANTKIDSTAYCVT
jgi:hypothetical protein